MKQHLPDCPAMEVMRSDKKRVAVLKGEPMPTFGCTCGMPDDGLQMEE